MRGLKTNNPVEIKLTKEQIDILKELGNIGSGNAITALSKLLSKEIKVSLTSVDISPFWKVPEFFEDPYQDIVGIYSKIHFNSDLTIIQIFTKESIINLINILTDFGKISIEDIKSIDDLDEFSYSIINEIGNILSGHYTNALANLLSIKLIPNVPKVAIDTLNALLEGIIAKYSYVSDYIIMINTKLVISDINLKGTICLIPSLNILNKLFKILNLKYSLNL